jgi:4-carboxymuconolactone decarboxylase
MNDRERHQAGMTVRRQVLSDAHVDRAVAGTDEFTADSMHVRAALRNGLTPEEVGEVLLQVGVYAGVPAANRAFKVTQQTLRQEAP